MDSNIQGKWIGNAFLQATANGFNSSKDVIKMNIYQQENLNFKGNIERIYKGNKILLAIQGYLDKNGRNICLTDQNNKHMIIGYVTPNEIIKLYLWENIESNTVTIYFLRKAEGHLILNKLQ